MASSKQVEANRKNAQHSTGPKTEKGKEVSRRNAMTHGLTAEHVLIEGEDKADYESVFEGLIVDFAPQTTLEQQLVERLAGYLWRLRRIPVLEAALLERQRSLAREEYIHEESKLTTIEQMRVRFPIPYKMAGPGVSAAEMRKAQDEAEKEAAARKFTEVCERPRDSALEFARAILRDASENDTLSKLSRYEAQLFNLVDRTIRQLEKLRHKSSGETDRRYLDLKPDQS